MLLAVTQSAGDSTLDLVAGVAILIWAIVGVVALYGWASRRLTGRPGQPQRSLSAAAHATVAWLRRRAAHDRILGAVVAGPGTPDSSDTCITGQPDQAAADGQVGSEPVIAKPATASEHPAAERLAARPPANPGARCSPETFELLGEHLDGSRRMAVVEDRLAPVLGALPRDRWLVERYVLIAGHRIPFLVLGETGVFALWALGGQPRWTDIPVVGRVADELTSALPGYTGTVAVGICRSLSPDIKTRWWCRSDEPGAWVMGLNSVIPWLEHFGPEHGLGVEDIQRVRELAGPHWGRGVTDLPASALVPDLERLGRG